MLSNNQKVLAARCLLKSY